MVAKPLVLNNQIQIIDVNTGYAPQSALMLLYDIDAINNQIGNLFGTAIGEADQEPEYGSFLLNRLFDPNNDQTTQLMELDVFNALSRWMEDKIIIRPGDIVVTMSDPRKVRTEFTYSIRQAPRIQIRYSFEIQRG